MHKLLKIITTNMSQEEKQNMTSPVTMKEMDLVIKSQCLIHSHQKERIARPQEFTGKSWQSFTGSSALDTLKWVGTELQK